ncbi:DUF2185 domain-containing protein [Parvularcula sp. ZS-1/3]|uniref:DUF2185 domain-containing protein n=1 Tax=Parvularcula mediterranea TaxID=2732508 RepID=A0A7Y3W4W4_9PROT|nr:DUF2185 domain-containing protein [Parvularcula mediterranea]NNU15667.1 DUF2185 domain-containing protein [Parvularcula mediterranea]
MAKVGVGDRVQLIFPPIEPDGEVPTERMWVKVTARSGADLEGVLDNNPDKLVSVSFGDAIGFSEWHIISVMYADGEQAPLQGQSDSYFKLCLVDSCVLDGSKLIHFLYREEPDQDFTTRRAVDSGWRIRGDYRDESDDEIDQREAQIVALGRVLNRDDTWLELINEPIGARFIRDWERNTFVPEGT